MKYTGVSETFPLCAGMVIHQGLSTCRIFLRLFGLSHMVLSIVADVSGYGRAQCQCFVPILTLQVCIHHMIVV